MGTKCLDICISVALLHLHFNVIYHWGWTNIECLFFGYTDRIQTRLISTFN